MRKTILFLLFGVMVIFSVSSCMSSAYAQDTVVSGTNDNVDVSVVIRHGTPYYFEGSILYYMYDGWYYYPYLYNNHYYYYRYRKPLPHPRYGHRFSPRYNDKPYFRHYKNYRPIRSSTHVRQQPRRNSPNFNNKPINRVSRRRR